MTRSSLVALAAIALLGRSLAAQQRTESPHGRLQEECALCHSPDGWRPARVSKAFNHAKWGFALEGAHGQTACSACHASLDFAGAAKECIACHQDVHRGEFGADCSRCHTPRSFVDRSGMLRMHQTTRFPLTGVHLVADCESCHAPSSQGQFTFVNRGAECQDCHLQTFLATTNPDHQATGFSHDCSQCHAVTTWTASRFNHDAGGFPLTGAHRALRCADCHTGNTFTGAPTNCVGCHQTDFDNTTDPAHGSSGFTTDCTVCHTTTTWQNATFDHNASGFQLTGAHRTATCVSCHTNGYSGGTPTTCIGCHQADYDQSSNPNHVAAGFPTDCTACHNTTGWTGANFNHDGNWFPVYSGRHKSVWTDCATCHTNSANYMEFTCLSCHEHSQTSTDGHHRGVRNYRYDSQACYSCHPRGRGD